LAEQLKSIIPDESIVDYLTEVASTSETVEEFCEIAVPIIIDLDEIANSEEDAAELCTALFHLKVNEVEEEGSKIQMSQPIIMSSLLVNSAEDPFMEDHLAMARLSIQEVGHVNDIDEDVTNKYYKKTLRKEEEKIEKIREERLAANDRENAQFKKGLGFRRPLIRHPRHLNLKGINVNIGPLTLIEDGSLVLSPGNRYGLVGRNGLGKTTFMKYVNSSLLRGVPDDMLIIHVEQEAPISDVTVLQTVLDCDLERKEIIEKLKALHNEETEEASEEIIKLTQRFEEIGGPESEQRAASILVALGFTSEMLNHPLSSCSGGFRMRVSIAQALYIKPDVLMLDEPTGHLDAPSVCWLEEFLTTQCKDQTLLVISHDRVFLDNVCTHIIHLKDKHLEMYKGNYSEFEKQFEARCKLLEAQSEAQKKDIEHKMDFVRRLGVKASTASMAQSRMKEIKKQEEKLVKPIKRDPPVHFEFPMSSEAAQEEIMVLEEVHFEYNPEKVIFDHLCFTICKQTRAVIIGTNGIGKSTFINLLLQNLKPQSGFFQQVSNLRIAHFSQHHVDQLNYRITPLQFMLSQYKDKYPLNAIRQHLGKFGVTGEMSLQPIQSLSGGQKTRVVLAACAMMQPHLMLLDEVTNNLDMDSIQALGEALSRYKGAIVAVTHDQHFAEMINAQIYVCKDQKMVKFDGSFQKYRTKVKNEIRDRFFKSAAASGL
jgi:ATP-binding cassette subfamily F protein 3